MLNPFPSLLTYSLIAPLILRVTLGYILANTGFLKLTKEKSRWEPLFEILGVHKQKVLVNQIIAGIEIIGGIALIAGAYTQIAALVFVLLTGIEMYIEHQDEGLIKRTIVFYILLFVIALSLLFTGAGFLAFDLPL